MGQNYPLLPNIHGPVGRDKEKYTRLSSCSALDVQKNLLLVHHRVDRVVLDREPGIVSCRIDAHLVGLHVAVRSGNLHVAVSDNLRP